MRRPDDTLLVDMLAYAKRVEAKVAGVCRHQFDADDNLQLALVYLTQTMGEAVSRLAQDVRAAHPEIPWREIIGMRHRVVHGYFRIDLDVVWESATQGVPDLVQTLAPIVAALADDKDTEAEAPEP